MDRVVVVRPLERDDRPLTRNVAMLHLFERLGAARVTNRYGDSLELEVELPFETGAPREALRAAAAWKPRLGSRPP